MRNSYPMEDSTVSSTPADLSHFQTSRGIPRETNKVYALEGIEKSPRSRLIKTRYMRVISFLLRTRADALRRSPLETNNPHALEPYLASTDTVNSPG